MQTPEDARRLRRNASAAAWRARNPGAQRAANARWYQTNLEVSKARYAAWYTANPEYFVKRRAADPLFKLAGALRHRVYAGFTAKGWSKTTKTQALLGCSYTEFIVHLQSKFKEGMTLENHGAWHIDHVKPCATATNAEELATLFHYTNLQPLWASENLSKGSTHDNTTTR